jgi:dipeptidyl aminopeptidase/acylaminoacyl peptidase
MSSRTASNGSREGGPPRKRPAPFGSWRSPITFAEAAGATVSLSECRFDGTVRYWLEGRPEEKGRQVIVRQEGDGPSTDVTPQGFNVRTRVHEYGGGAYNVRQGRIVFSNVTDGRLYRQRSGDAPQPITPEGALRYADIEFDERRGRIICIQEDHTNEGQEAVNRIVAVKLPSDGGDGGSSAPGPDVIQTLVEGNDFYSNARVSPDGSHLAWVTWNHPEMPWTGPELWIGAIDADGGVSDAVRAAGGSDESIAEPEWMPDGRLCFVSDRSGWWNLYRLNLNPRTTGQLDDAEPLAPMEAECARPQWGFGLSSYAFSGNGDILFVARQEGSDHLYRVTPGSSPQSYNLPFREIPYLRAHDDQALLTGGGPFEPTSVAVVDLQSGNAPPQVQILKRSLEVSIDPEYISPAEHITFTSTGGRIAHALLYRPRNKEFAGPDGELPPLVVSVHGGPTGEVSQTLSLATQAVTSRGIMVVDVDYSGSTGYGREYRRRLEGQWGIVDVEDCIAAARYLVEAGEADPNRLVIRGGSSGGYATLCALTFHQVFSAGASYYGIADLEMLAKDTHKFESHYMESLIGPYPQRRDLYEARSPIHFTDRLSKPLIILQGLDDKVVPPNQSQTMADALKAKRIPYAYLTFEGEAHGFRQAQNIQRSLEAELSFYAQIFGFQLADQIEPVHIEFLSQSSE